MLSLYLTFILAFRDYNVMLNEDEQTQDEVVGADVDHIDGEEESIELLESLSDSAEIAAVKKEEMQKCPHGQDPVTKAYRLPCTAHKVCCCHLVKNCLIKLLFRYI